MAVFAHRTNRTIGLLFILLVSLWLVALAPARAQSDACTYTVQAGDTLGRIAATQGTTVAVIVALNPQITNVNLIYPGQVIILPDCAGAPATDDAPPGVVEIVEPEDELIAIPAKPANLSQVLWQPVHDATFNIRYPVDAPYVGGSGVMIGQDGRTFLTAYHVIDHWESDEPLDYEQTVEIGPYAEWRYTADVMAVEPGFDLAVLRVNEGDFPGFSVAPVGDSRSLRFGDPIYTLSYPLEGTELRTSKGSFLERYLDPYYLVPILVTDAEANYGSSGGVALNARGEVIGIISAGIIGREYVEYFGYSGADTLTIIVPIEAAFPMFNEVGVALNRPNRTAAQP